MSSPKLYILCLGTIAVTVFLLVTQFIDCSRTHHTRYNEKEYKVQDATERNRYFEFLLNLDSSETVVEFLH